MRERYRRLKGDLVTRATDVFTAAVQASMNPEKAASDADKIRSKYRGMPIDAIAELLPERRERPNVRDLVSIDFFTVPTAGLRVLFVLVVLAHDRRRVLHFNVTEHPTAAWTAQQIVDAFPDDSAPSYLLRDRDKIYGHSFRQRVRGMGIDEILTAPHSPWQNPFA